MGKSPPIHRLLRVVIAAIHILVAVSPKSSSFDGVTFLFYGKSSKPSECTLLLFHFI